MCVTNHYISFLLRHRKMSAFWSNIALRPQPMCYILFILVRVSAVSFCRYISSQGCSSPFTIQDGWKPMFFYTFSQSLLLVSYPFLKSVYSLLLRVSMFTYCKMDCEDENLSTDIFRFGADSAHLFDLWSDQWSYCITEGTCNDASFRPKRTFVC